MTRDVFRLGLTLEFENLSDATSPQEREKILLRIAVLEDEALQEQWQRLGVK